LSSNANTPCGDSPDVFGSATFGGFFLTHATNIAKSRGGTGLLSS
jgi:hypothetical protein